MTSVLYIGMFCENSLIFYVTFLFRSYFFTPPFAFFAFFPSLILVLSLVLYCVRPLITSFLSLYQAALTAEISILLICFCSFDLFCPLLEKDTFIKNVYIVLSRPIK